MGRVLVAGIGNIFLGDDAFGVEVARRLGQAGLAGDVSVKDFGIRGLHLAYELLDGGYQLAILVDASPRGGKPGTVYLIEPDLSGAGAMADAHSMTPDAVFGMLKSLGGNPGRVLIVGCEPASVEEGMGLSEPVQGAIGEAIEMIRDVIAREGAAAPRT